MPIPLQTKLAPALKLPNIGDTVVVALGHQASEPMFVTQPNGTKVRATTMDGKERSQLKMTVLVLSGKAVTGKDGNEEPVAVGSEAVIYLSGHNWWDYIQASDKIGGVNVGDVVQWKYEGDEPGKGSIPKKIRRATPRHAKPEEAASVAACEAIYRRITATPLEAAAPTAGPFDDTEEDPF